MLQWMDDFTSYGTDANRLARLTNGSYAEQAWCDLVADPDPSAGGQFCLSVGSNTNSIIRRVLTAAQGTVGTAARYWLTNIPSDTNQRPHFASFRDINNNIHVWVTVNPTGYVEAYRHDNAGDVLIAQSASPVIVANAWRHIECKLVLSAAAGSIEVHLEGAQVLNVAGIRTTTDVVGVAATCSTIAIQNTRGAAAGPQMYVKDLIMWDGSGAVNNSFMGSCQVYKIIPNGDVSLGWTPSAGVTGYDKINLTTPLDDGSYISAPFPLPPASTFSMSDLPANVTAVKGVMILQRSRKTDGGDGQVQASLLSGASVGAGANRTITTAYTYWTDMFDLDPQGAINWSPARVNALNLKLDRTV